MSIEVVKLSEKFGKFTDRWSPKIVAELNDSYLKLVKIAGHFEWHHHTEEDELFLVVRGTLHLRIKESSKEKNFERNLVVHPGEFVVIPRMVEHLPWSDEECEVILIEPKSTLNTGSSRTARTLETLERI